MQTSDLIRKVSFQQWTVWLMQKPTTVPITENRGLRKAQLQIGLSLSLPSPPLHAPHRDRYTQRLRENGGRGKTAGQTEAERGVFSCNPGTTLIRSQQHQCPVGELHKMKPLDSSACAGRVHGFSRLTKQILGKAESVFLKHVTPGRSTIAGLHSHL